MVQSRFRQIFSSIVAVVLYTLLAAYLPSGCSSEKSSPTLPGAHPVSWMEAASPDFHGRLVYQNGTESCAHCHGINSPGGRVEISCLDCHGPGGADCSRCHGGEDNSSGAPPAGLRGESADTSLAVGAHTAHLVASWLAAAVPCSTCHTVPLFFLSPGHVDQPGAGGQPPDSIAEIVWHGLADPGAAAWNRVRRTCAGTYCHGNFSGGYANNAPVWTGANQATCGSCHDVGRDPGQLGGIHNYHVNTAGLACGDCHFSVVDTFLTITNPDLHVNGQVEFLVRNQTTCDNCHGTGPEVCIQCHGGTDNQTGAPPLGLEGETAISQLAVGAHTTHMEGGSQVDAFACSDCHRVPSSMLSIGHLGTDEIAEITWSTLAGSSASWNRTNARCSTTYCHGNFAGGYSANNPLWTGTNQAGCGSCHDVGSNLEDLSGEHKKHVEDEGLDCEECHETVVNASMAIIDPALHVNGVKNVSLLRGGRFQGGGCTGLNGATCHGAENWD